MTQSELMHKIDEILYGEHSQPFSTGDQLRQELRNKANKKFGGK